MKQEAATPEEALVPVHSFSPSFEDDLDQASLILALTRNLQYLKTLEPSHTFIYGPDRFSCRQVRETQEAFLRVLSQGPSPQQIRHFIHEHFLIYRATGRMENPKVLFTGYFEPLYEASLTSDQVFRYPLYRKPHDLITIDLSLFHEKYQGQSIVARVQDNRVFPYYSRQEIDEGKILAGCGLEIAWLKDPVDAMFLHIQGSGRLRLPDGKTLAVGYGAQNGRPYRSIGRTMVQQGFLEREKVSMQSIREYLSNHPEAMAQVLFSNPSYVFFQVRGNGPVGNINVPLTPGRSLALDSHLFPRGALAYIITEKPLVDSSNEITGWTRFSRFLLNQDTGGAIKGAGRADIFWGTGSYAELAAGHLRHEGELYILIQKP